MHTEVSTCVYIFFKRTGRTRRVRFRYRKFKNVCLLENRIQYWL